MGFKDFMKGIGDTVESGAKKVSDGSKKMAEKSRVKKEIAQLENDINNGYYAIGKKYFELHSAEPGEDYAELVNEIIAKNERAEKFKLLLASMEDKMPCTSCGAIVTREQKFCDKCGAKVEMVEPPIIEGFNDAPPAPQVDPNQPAPAAGGFCANCGAPLDAGQNFCEKCGTKND